MANVTIKIPDNPYPIYTITVNNIEYAYPAGQTVSVPDFVAAAIIDNVNGAAPRQDPPTTSIEDALKMAANFDVRLSQDGTNTTITVIDRDGNPTSVTIQGGIAPQTWADIMYAVRSGRGPELFPVGTELTTEKAVSATAEIGALSTGITDAEVDLAAFVAAMGEAKSGVTEFEFDGTAWRLGTGSAVQLSAYGITATGTAADGDTILVTETTVPITWRVVDHDHYEAADPNLTHTMALETKYVYSDAEGTYKGIDFSAPKALYYCSEALPAGTYNFTWNYATGSMVNGTYQFTLTEGVPAGGQIVLGTNGSSTAITSCKIQTYGSVGSDTAIERNIVVTEGSGGTSLGTISATTSDNADLCCAQRIILGANNYAQGDVRQWLNSTADLHSVWVPQTKFDRPPSWHTGSDAYYAGFAHGLGADFLGAVKAAKVICRTNDVYEIDSLNGAEFDPSETYTLTDKFFLLSRPEIFGAWDSESLKDGSQLAYYQNLSVAELIKRDVGGTARNIWLRSPGTTSANYERAIYSDGNLTIAAAQNNNSVAPACIIA